MFGQFKTFLVVCMVTLPFILVSCTHAKPNKPGSNFVWVKRHVRPNGNLVPGRWNYVGPSRNKMVWVPRHRSPKGKWIPGHWKPR